jgi:hypothetical protein
MPTLRQATSPRPGTAFDLTKYVRTAVAALLVVAAAFVVSRRLAGALETALGPIPLLAAGLALAGLAWIAGAPWPNARNRVGGPGLDTLMISLATLSIALSLSLTGSHPFALVGFWAVVIAGELWTWRGVLFRASVSKVGPPVTPPYSALPEHSRESDEPAEPAADVLQQLTLRRTAEGGHELSGWLRMPLAAGQRTGSLHVAFCPSFDHAPTVQAEPVSGPDCRVKAAQILPCGTRLDVKLDEAAGEGDNALVWFHAACSVGQA